MKMHKKKKQTRKPVYTERIQACLTPETLKTLQTLSEENNLSVSNQIRKLIEDVCGGGGIMSFKNRDF